MGRIWGSTVGVGAVAMLLWCVGIMQIMQIVIMGLRMGLTMGRIVRMGQLGSIVRTRPIRQIQLIRQIQQIQRITQIRRITQIIQIQQTIQQI